MEEKYRYSSTMDNFGIVDSGCICIVHSTGAARN